jgi:hypothetical protein
MCYISRIFLILILNLTAVLFGCQVESEEIVTPLLTETVSKESISGSLLYRISERDGSEDNIVDGSSCTTIVFPFTVIVNGTAIEIFSEEDYDLIEDIIDELEDDTDEVVIQFPVDVVFADHTVIRVNNMDELDDLLEECVEGGLDDDIECVDISYPITFSIYNEVTEQASTATVDNDKELYQFLEDLEEGEIVSLNFPISLVLFTGEIITVEDNAALEATIEQYKDSCDEDDDNDFDDDDLDDTELIHILKESIWIVSAYDSASRDKTDLFDGYEIAFLDSNVLLANDGSEEFEGEWETEGNDNYLELSTEFDNDGDLRLLNYEWRVINFDSGRIELTAHDPEQLISVIMRVK